MVDRSSCQNTTKSCGLTMKIFYRFSFNNMPDHTGTPRSMPDRPEWFDKWKCLENFTNVFAEQDITIIADGIDDEVWDKITLTYPMLNIQRTNFGHNAGSFLYSLEQAVNLDPNEIVYFVEDDYVHHEGSDLILEQGLSRCAYVSLYDHPDKYINQQGQQSCLLIKTDNCHWRTTPSTTMTFATRAGFLMEDKHFFYRWCGGEDNWTHDSQLFNEISQIRGLITPIPGYATQCDLWVVDSLIDWIDVLNRTTT